MRILVLFCTAAAAAMAQPDVHDIMSRVAINQAKSQELREEYIYHQSQLLRMIRGSGRLAREEKREYAITPEVHSIKRELSKFEGKYESHGQYFGYDRPGYEYKGIDIDGQLLDDMSRDMLADRKSRDGVARDLFPLTYHEQLKYNFKLVRTETYRGRQAYRVAFEPIPHLHCPDHEPIWKGEALIDAEEYQPILVTTKMALKIPLVVRTVLGTNIRGLGFSVTYQKFEDGVWFPVSYGGEFEVRALFLYKRTITVSAVNSDFRRTNVASSITYATGREN